MPDLMLPRFEKSAEYATCEACRGAIEIGEQIVVYRFPAAGTTTAKHYRCATQHFKKRHPHWGRHAKKS
jgi:hypothetical protein